MEIAWMGSFGWRETVIKTLKVKIIRGYGEGGDACQFLSTSAII